MYNNLYRICSGRVNKASGMGVAGLWDTRSIQESIVFLYTSGK